jgi:hypothetical protein
MMYIVYKITNILNNYIYIGIHYTSNINDSYMGSGTNIKKAIKEFGISNFNKEVLFIFDNKEDMILKEKELVNKEFILREDTYNISLGGGTYNSTDMVVTKDIHGNIFTVNKLDKDI